MRAYVKREFQRKMKIKFKWIKEEESEDQIQEDQESEDQIIFLSFVLFCSYA